jgi:hypothetical protein
MLKLEIFQNSNTYILRLIMHRLHIPQYHWNAKCLIYLLFLILLGTGVHDFYLLEFPH